MPGKHVNDSNSIQGPSTGPERDLERMPTVPRGRPASCPVSCQSSQRLAEPWLRRQRVGLLAGLPNVSTPNDREDRGMHAHESIGPVSPSDWEFFWEHRRTHTPPAARPASQAQVSAADPRLTPGTARREERKGEPGHRDPARAPRYPAPPWGRDQGSGRGGQRGVRHRAPGTRVSTRASRTP